MRNAKIIIIVMLACLFVCGCDGGQDYNGVVLRFSYLQSIMQVKGLAKNIQVREYHVNKDGQFLGKEALDSPAAEFSMSFSEDGNLVQYVSSSGTHCVSVIFKDNNCPIYWMQKTENGSSEVSISYESKKTTAYVDYIEGEHPVKMKMELQAPSFDKYGYPLRLAFSFPGFTASSQFYDMDIWDSSCHGTWSPDMLRGAAIKYDAQHRVKSIRNDACSSDYGYPDENVMAVRTDGGVCRITYSGIPVPGHKGSKETLQHFTENGDLSRTVIHSFNEHGDLVKVESADATGEEYKYQYNVHGDWVTRLRSKEGRYTLWLVSYEYFNEESEDSFETLYSNFTGGKKKAKTSGSSSTATVKSATNQSAASQQSSQPQTQPQQQRQKVPMQEWVPCPSCLGSATCQWCGGTGWGFGNYSCAACHGSGRCVNCNGTGGHYEVRYY